MTRFRRPRIALLALLALLVLILGLAAPAGTVVRAQAPGDLPPGVQVEVTVGRDGDTIGDPVRLTVVVTHPAGGELLVPPPEGPLGDLEPAAPSVTRTTNTDGAQRVTLVYDTRAFVTGLLTLQPPRLSYRTADGIAGLTPPAQTVDVLSLLPADGSLVVRPLKPAETIPQAGFPILPVALGMGIPALLIAGTLIWRKRHRPPATAAMTAAPPGPTATATRDLDGLGAAGLLPHAIDEFCARLNGVVRGYLAARYRLPARNLTARELSQRLARAGADAGTVQRVRNLCQACDEIAYAGARPSPDRVARYLDLAQAIVQPRSAPAAADATPASATPAEAARDRGAPGHDAPDRWARPPGDD